MELTVERLFSNDKSTLGILFINGMAECFTMEDERRVLKVKGETRIFAGTYKLKLRSVGESPKWDARYKTVFGDAHVGMIEICDVPEFSNVLIHTGNSEVDTMGCLLVGLKGDINRDPYLIEASVDAYRRLYPKVVAELLEGKEVNLTMVDRDTSG